MKNLTRKLSAMALSALFASMQVSFANPIDTGLGNGLGGAVINSTQGGYAGMTTGNGTADLNFNGNAHVNWNTLNVNKNETLNFNAVDNANNLTILNTVNNGMSTIYGQINANSGIGKLIISNPNGMLFDGAKFTTAGDLMLTTQNLAGLGIKDLENLEGNFTKVYDDNGLIGITIKNGAVFDVNGDFNIIAPAIVGQNSTVTANNLKLVTANGQDYLSLGKTLSSNAHVVNLKAMNVNGDVYITSDKGVVRFDNGGNYTGNVNVNSNGNVVMNYNNDGEKLVIGGNLNANANDSMMFLRNSEVGGNVTMQNDGGFVDVEDTSVKGNAKLTTTGVSTNNKEYNHFVHVIGNTTVDGDLDIEASQNIHIGGYNYDAQKLAEGNLKVGGDLNAHSTDGHVMVTIDTQADKINLKSDTLNILTDGKATMKANDYKFSANGYIGGLTGTEDMSVDNKIVNIMENYIYVPSVGTPAYLNIDGGTVSKVDTTTEARIASNGDMTVTGTNAPNVYLTSYGKNINIEGDGVHADTITVGGETDTLKVDFPSRDYKLKYTNIRDNEVVTVNGTDEITYELTNGENGYNINTTRPEKTTYLVGPDKEVVTPVEPEPEPTPEPEVTIPNVSDNDNAKILNNMDKNLLTEAIDAIPVDTPVAYAADLDDEPYAPVRKNVDGSVTVVRAFPMVN